MESIKRITLTGTAQAVSFEFPVSKFFIKNFTQAEIYVDTEAECEVNTSCKIPADYAQEFVINEYNALNPETETIYIKGTGEVEIQAICHR